MNDERLPMPSSGTQAGRGPQSLHLPFLDEKLRTLLMLVGRNQMWLASSLGVSPPAVTNWKLQERMPALHAQLACRLLCIDLQTLAASDLEQFHAGVDAAFAPGSGRRWKTLVRQAQEIAEGLLLFADRATERALLRAVVFSRDPARPQRPHLPQVGVEEQIRFALAGEAVVALGATPSAIVLCVEDQHGWMALCPTPQALGFVEQDGLWWVPDPARRGLQMQAPLGSHRAVAVLTAAPLPNTIEAAFRSSQVEWACDAFAAWLTNEGIGHAAFARSFIVTA